MDDLVSFYVLCITSFITIVNPVSILPVFITMTSNFSEERRRATASKAVLTAFVAMLLFAFMGKFIFDFFNITANGFRIVGGVIFFKMGYDMLRAHLSQMKIDKNDIKEYATDISITPLGIPMLCGPGAITNSIILMGQSETFWKKIVLILSMLTICVVVLLTLYGGSKIIKLIGETGIKIMMRIMGLILMVVAVEYFIAGITPVLQNILGTL